jgi:hypothetical protein
LRHLETVTRPKFLVARIMHWCGSRIVPYYATWRHFFLFVPMLVSLMRSGCAPQ